MTTTHCPTPNRYVWIAVPPDGIPVPCPACSADVQPGEEHRSAPTRPENRP